MRFTTAEDVNLASLMTCKLQDDMRGRSETVQAKPVTSSRATQLKGTIANHAGAKQGCSMGIVECGRKRVREIFVHRHVLCIAAVGVQACELGAIAEIFAAHPAVGTGAVRAEETRYTDAIALAELESAGAPRLDDANDLVSRDERKPGKL